MDDSGFATDGRSVRALDKFSAAATSSAFSCLWPSCPFGRSKQFTTVLSTDVCSKTLLIRICGAVYADTTIAGTRGPSRSKLNPVPPSLSLGMTLPSPLGLVATLQLPADGDGTWS